MSLHFCNVQPKFVPVKLVYFIYIACKTKSRIQDFNDHLQITKWNALAVIRPYLPVFMVDLGLNTFQVGILKCMEPITILATSPVWGAIADKFNVHKGMLILCALGSGLCFPLLILVPPVELLEGGRVESRTTFKNDTYGRNVGEIYDPARYEYLNFSKISGIPNREGWPPSFFTQASLITFTLIGGLALIDNIFMAGFLPLLDSSTMELCNRYPGNSYGGQRWPGAFAVVVFSPVTGFLIDWFSNSDINLGEAYFLHSKYLPSFLLFTLLMLVTVIPVSFMEVLGSKASPSISRELFLLFKDFHVILTFVLFIVVGICKGIVVGFLFIFLEELNASNILMSLSLVATCVAETPCLIFSGKVIEKLGYEVVFALGLGAYIVRLLCYSLLQDPWMVLFIEPLHGICYGLIWPCCTVYANHIAPDGMSATLQSLTHAAKAGVGEVIGVIGGGLIYQLYGGRRLFVIAAAVSACVLIVYIVDVSIFQRKTSDKTKLSPDGNEIQEEQPMLP